MELSNTEAVLVAARAVRRALAHRTLKPLARAKVAFAESPQMTVRELARASGVGRGTAHRAIGKTGKIGRRPATSKGRATCTQQHTKEKR